MTPMTPSTWRMPPAAPLSMPAQRLDRRPGPALPPRERAAVHLARLFVFGFATLAALALGVVLWDWFRGDGLSWAEGAIVGLAPFTMFWIALSVATALIGCVPSRGTRAGPGPALDIAILLPIYGEDPETVLRAAARLLSGLRAAGPRHRFCLHVLSDTRDALGVAAERRVLSRIAAARPDLRLHYRHRAENTRYKAGNVEEWISNWGGAHDAMLLLDADSVMDPEAVLRMADEMAADPRLGLVQSVPRLIGARSIFARTQQFSNTVYGATLGRGLARWAGQAGNYWGHNALIRVPAFAAAAGLPDLPGRRPLGGVILSHDFVEAALLVRAGWRVRFLPQAGGSYEGGPETILAHVLRDRRWCQGNIQHLRLIATRGLHMVSRVHLLQGAMGYLSSVLWFALILLWLTVDGGRGEGVVRYFAYVDPRFASWSHMEIMSRAAILALIYGMLLAPRLIGAAMFWWMDPTLRSAGGPARFAGSFLLDLAVSILLAPMLMVQHVICVLRTFTGQDTGWKPADKGRPGFETLLRFHRVEVAGGLTLAALYAAGALTPWLLPVVVSLILAPALSWATAAEPAWAARLFLTPQDIPEEAPDAAPAVPQAA